MPKPNIKKSIEWIANVGILVVCGLFIWSFITHKTINFNTRASNDYETEAAKFIGLKLPQPQNYQWSSHPATLVLGIRVRCHFCEASLPFYKSLAKLEEQHSIHTHILTIMPDSRLSASAMLSSAGLKVEGVFNEQLSDVHVALTPTLLLVDGEGVVQHAWLGQLPTEKEHEVVATLK